MKDKCNINKEYKTKKSLGQCFLTDSFVINKIVRAVGATKDNTVIEIGPGSGAITKGLLESSKKVIAFEIDKDVIPVLTEKVSKYGDLLVINEDILKADLDILKNVNNPILVSNLPYYITSPIISLFFEKMENINRAVFMMQKEVGDRITATVGTKDYNAFSIMVQYYSDVKKIINVSRKSFSPSPNVDSVVVEISKKDPEYKCDDENLFKKVVYLSFKERRKTLVNNLSSSFGVSKDVLKKALLDLELKDNVRSEQLTIKQFVALTKELKKLI